MGTLMDKIPEPLKDIYFYGVTLISLGFMLVSGYKMTEYLHDNFRTKEQVRQIMTSPIERIESYVEKDNKILSKREYIDNILKD